VGLGMRLEYTRHAILVTLSVSTIHFEERSCTSKKEQDGREEGGGKHTHNTPCTWRLFWLAIEWLWFALSLLSQVKKSLPPLVGAPFLALEEIAVWRRALTIVSWVISGWGQSHCTPGK